MDAEFFDSIYEGDSAQGTKLGMGLTGGDFWPRIDGCTLLYRGKDMQSINFQKLLAVGQACACFIRPPMYLEHEIDTMYFYLARRANCCGDEEQSLRAAARPGAVFAPNAKQKHGRIIELRWYYCSLGQKSEPVCFRIYSDDGTGEINYADEVGAVEYVGKGFYRYLTEPLEKGSYHFVIRTENKQGVNDCSYEKICVSVEVDTPAAIDVVELGVV